MTETEPSLNNQYSKSDIAAMRSDLTKMARGIRVGVVGDTQKLDEPLSVRWDEALFDGRDVSRLRIVALSLGCSVSSCTMCPLPAESVGLDRRRQIMAENAPRFMKMQIDNALAVLPPENNERERVAVFYTNGNVFDQKEVPEEVLVYLFDRVRESDFSSLVVESLPNFINQRVIDLADEHLGGKRLYVMEGLQSASRDPNVRELAVNTTCTTQGYERTLKMLRSINGEALTFLMLKPPFLSEREGVEDIVESVKWLNDLQVYNPTICPTRVAPDTVLEILYKDGDFRPPWLWSIVESLKRIHEECPNSIPRVATSEINQTANPDSVCPYNCPKCTPEIVRRLNEYNRTGDFSLFDRVGEGFCDCYGEYQKALLSEDEKYPPSSSPDRIPSRVDNFLKKHKAEVSTLLLK